MEDSSIWVVHHNLRTLSRCRVIVGGVDCRTLWLAPPQGLSNTTLGLFQDVFMCVFICLVWGECGWGLLQGILAGSSTGVFQFNPKAMSGSMGRRHCPQKGRGSFLTKIKWRGRVGLLLNEVRMDPTVQSRVTGFTVPNDVGEVFSV